MELARAPRREAVRSGGRPGGEEGGREGRGGGPAAVSSLSHSGPPRAGRLSALATRAFDVAAALVLLPLTLPLLLAGLAVVAASGGAPLFFGHRRVGKGGRTFRCWKLRTMQVDAETRLVQEPELHRLHRENGFKIPASRDPRIIPGGRWLRRTHLDELPQLFNVLVGDMSLLGPRPVVEQELGLYGEHRDLILSVRPGILGEWTSRGRRRPPYPERARLEAEWVRERGLGRNLRILFRSVGAVLSGQEEG